jgi:hypothetical protein
MLEIPEEVLAFAEISRAQMESDAGGDLAATLHAEA